MYIAVLKGRVFCLFVLYSDCRDLSWIVFVIEVLFCFKMAECLIVFQDSNMSFDSVVARVVVGKPIDTIKDNREANLIKRTMPSNLGGNSCPSGGLYKNLSQRSTGTNRTQDLEHNQDINRLRGSKSVVNNLEYSSSGKRSIVLKKKFRIF